MWRIGLFSGDFAALQIECGQVLRSVLSIHCGYSYRPWRAKLSGEERTGKKYPFDIQHRTVTPYQADAPSDFETLRSAITARLKALAKRDIAMREISKNEKVAPVAGLSQPELIVLASAAGNVMLPGEGITAYIVKNDVERSGFTTLGFALGIKRLTARGFVTLRKSSDYNGEPYQEIVLADVAWDWIEQNESKFVIRKQDDPTSEPDPF